MSIFDKIHQKGGDDSSQPVAADIYVDVIRHVLVSPSFLEQSRNTVATMRAVNGLPAVTGRPIAFEHAYEQISGDMRGHLMLSHDLDDEESFFIMVPPGWWWFADNITPEMYDGMMERAIHEARQRDREQGDDKP